MTPRRPRRPRGRARTRSVLAPPTPSSELISCSSCGDTAAYPSPRRCRTTACSDDHAGGRQAIARLVVGLARRRQRGRGRGGLVAGRLLPGERLEHPAALLWRHLGRQRPNRAAVELHRLPVRGDPGGGSSAGERRPVRLRGPSRELEVLRRVHRRPDARVATELGDEAVQPAALGKRDRRIDRIPHQLVAEVVLAGPVVGLEERVCRELREGRREGLVRHRQDLAGDRGQEPPADHRARRRQRSSFR